MQTGNAGDHRRRRVEGVCKDTFVVSCCPLNQMLAATRTQKKPQDHSPPGALSIERDSVAERLPRSTSFLTEILILPKHAVAASEQSRFRSHGPSGQHRVCS